MMIYILMMSLISLMIMMIFKVKFRLTFEIVF